MADDLRHPGCPARCASSRSLHDLQHKWARGAMCPAVLTGRIRSAMLLGRQQAAISMQVLGHMLLHTPLRGARTMGLLMGE